MPKVKPTHFRPQRFYHSLMSKIAAFITGLFSNMKVEGLENIPRTGGAVIVANHFSYFDAFALTTALDRSRRDTMVMGKAELFRSPWKAAILRRIGAIPVYRGSERAGDALKEGVNSLRHGELVSLFPEGTIFPDGRLGKFKTGPVRMALEAGVPIIPVTMVGTNKVIPSAMKRIKRTLWKRSVFHADIRVKIGAPIYLKGSVADKLYVVEATENLRFGMERQLRSIGYDQPSSVPFIRKRDFGLTVFFSVPVVGFIAERIYKARKKS